MLFACKWLSAWDIKELEENLDGRHCICASASHEVALRGKDRRGAWATSAAKRYNMAFAGELAHTIHKLWMAKICAFEAQREG